MKAIFEEAIDQEFVERNPARKLIMPEELRPVDRTTLTWDQLRLVLASALLRDRIFVDSGHDGNVPAQRAVRTHVERLQ